MESRCQSKRNPSNRVLHLAALLRNSIQKLPEWNSSMSVNSNPHLQDSTWMLLHLKALYSGMEIRFEPFTISQLFQQSGWAENNSRLYQRDKNCHLLTLMLFQTLSSVEHKRTVLFIQWTKRTKLDPTDLHWMDKNNIESLLKYLLFHRRKSVIQVWDNMGLSNWWQIFIFGWTLSLMVPWLIIPFLLQFLPVTTRF